jgi:hypothetical protein
MGASSMAGMGLAASLQAGIRTTGPAQESSFSGQEAQACRSLRELRLVDRTDPATLLVAKRIMNLRSRASVIPTHDCARVPLRGSDVSPYRASLSVSGNPLSCAVLGKSDPASMSERSCAQCPVVGILVRRNTLWSA